MNHMIAPVELTDSELDAVSGGQHDQTAAGLVVAQVAVGDITVEDSLNILQDANVGVQAAVLNIGRGRQRQDVG